MTKIFKYLQTVYRELCILLFLGVQWTLFLFIGIALVFASKKFFSREHCDSHPFRWPLVKSYHRLLKQDCENVRTGLYPLGSLFGFTFIRFFRQFYGFYKEAERMGDRQRRNAWKEMPAFEEKKRAFPQYYLRNYHWLPGGYLTQASAEIYDLSLELQMQGGVHCLRRIVVGEIAEFYDSKSDVEIDILDVGCGTGQLVKSLCNLLPRLTVHGIELSPFYSDFSQRLLENNKNATILQGDGCSLPYANNSVGCVVTVFLQHELPRSVRKKMLDEFHRVLVSDGILITLDAVQFSDAPEIARLLESLVKRFHEPYYADYLRANSREQLSAGGFQVADYKQVFSTQVLAARKIPR